MGIRDIFFAYWNALDQHKGWIDLGMGMPSPELFSPLLNFEDAFALGMQHRADYQPQAGAFSVRQAIAEYEAKLTGTSYTPENIMLVSGALRGFSLVLDNLVKPGTNLVEIVPTYPLLAGFARYIAERTDADVVTVTPRDKQHFLVEADEILPFIKESTVIYVTNPSNPTGLYIPARTMQSIVATCEQRNAYLVVDESCDMPLSDELSASYAIQSPSLIRIRGLSKNILLAGFRAGYIVADAQIIQKISSYSAFSDANAPLVFNEVIESYVQHPEVAHEVSHIVRSMVQEASHTLRSMQGIEHLIRPEACYYIFLKVRYSGGSWNLFQHFLDAGVNVVPGTLFGIDDQEAWVRVCCARDAATLAEGINRMKGALASL